MFQVGKIKRNCYDVYYSMFNNIFILRLYMPETHELILEPGLVVDQEFFDYSLMQQSSKNWLYTLRYRFSTGTFYGRHDGIQLNNLQFGHAIRKEGLMLEGVSPKDCLTFALVQKSPAPLCINRLKLKTGEVIIIDDEKSYDFVSSAYTKLAIVSISKALIAIEMPWILNAIDKKFKDKDNILSETIEREWGRVIDEPTLSSNIEALDEMEKKIIDALKKAFTPESGEGCHLTTGEMIAFEVKAFLLTSLEETMTVQSICKQFEITDKTLETSFKSLFGITPKRFINLLKLNRAHEDLLSIDVESVNVSDIASKWGFNNFDRFAHQYEALFGVLPSKTIQTIE